MKIIDLYIIKKFLSTFAFIIIAFVLIAIVFDFSEKVDNFINHKAPLKAILFEYYLNFIPYFINLFSPLFIFIAAIYFTSRMAANTEIVAMLTTGTNFYRLLFPYMFVAALLTSLSLYLNGQVIPKGNRKLLDFENKYLLDPYFNDEIHIHRQVAEGVYIYMQAFNAVDTIGYAFALEEFDGMELRYKVQSQTIQWDNKDQKWVLNNYMMRKIDGLKEDIVTGKQTIIELPIKPEDFGRKDKNIQTMNNRELAEYIRIEELRGDSMIVHYKVEKHKRIAMPFATFVLVLIAFSVSAKKTRGGIGIHLFLGIMIAFSYLLFMQFSKVFSIKGQLDPMIAIWIPNLLYAILGFYLLKKAPK